jgi:hypothetical protein
MIDETRGQLIRDLEAVQKQLSVLLESLVDDQDWQPNPGEWSFRYIAAHLATVDKDCFKDRVVRIAAGKNPYFEAYFNTGWDFSRLDLSDSLREWAVVRQEIFDLVRALPEESWSLTGTHATFGTIAILSVLQTMLRHDQEHLQHLEQLLEGYGLNRRGMPQ